MEYSLQAISRILFELSNLCNYAILHNKCPLHYTDSHTILPAEVIYKIAAELKPIEYSGVFSFHRYNEPFIDPRLFLFSRYLKKEFPNCHINTFTNGYYMSQSLADELSDYGFDSLTISLYSIKEEERLKAISYPIKVNFFTAYKSMDNRIDAYGDVSIVRNKPCKRSAPLKEININAYGDVSLCCMDWKNQYNFGNIMKENLSEIINKDNFKYIYENIASGNPQLSLCNNCIVG